MDWVEKSIIVVVATIAVVTIHYMVTHMHVEGPDRRVAAVMKQCRVLNMECKVKGQK